MSESPVREIRIICDDSGNPRYVNRLLVATPTLGTVMMEWVAGRYGQIIDHTDRDKQDSQKTYGIGNQGHDSRRHQTGQGMKGGIVSFYMAAAFF